MGRSQGKKQEKKNLKRPKQDDDSYELNNYDEQDEQIQDDGQQSSEHSSINLQQYLKNRDNIPSQPSDAPDEEDDDQQDEDDEQEQDDDVSQQQVKPKATKKQKLEEKKELKGSKNKRNVQDEDDEQEKDDQ